MRSLLTGCLLAASLTMTAGCNDEPIGYRATAPEYGMEREARKKDAEILDQGPVASPTSQQIQTTH